MLPEMTLTCPIPIQDYPHVLMAHGSGGRLMQQLIEGMFLATFGNPKDGPAHDAAVLSMGQATVAMTTDAFVVHPLFFPGGDIGQLAIHGTVNDLAMAGAVPQYLSVSFILEEGLLMADLWRIVQSMQSAAKEAGVRIVTGDTKVVDRGKGDGIYINTTGLGVIQHNQTIAPSSVSVGDMIIVNGDLARHGMAIMAVREGLQFESAITSDTAALNGIVQDLLAANITLHCLRDLTRGGLASALNEISQGASVVMQLQEKEIPVREDVSAACELLGIDPLYVANEGRFVAFVPDVEVSQALEVLRQHPLGKGAKVIGKVTEAGCAQVTLTSLMGANRIVDMISGAALPRIC